MTVEAKRKVSTFGKSILIAVIGLVGFFVGRIEMAGQYKEKVDKIEVDLKDHITWANKANEDVVSLKTHTAVIDEQYKAILKKLEKIEDKLDRRHN